MATLREMRAEKAQKSEDLAKIFDSIKDMSELSSDQKEEIKKRNDELAELGSKITELSEYEEMKAANKEEMEANLLLKNKTASPCGLAAGCRRGRATSHRRTT